MLVTPAPFFFSFNEGVDMGEFGVTLQLARREKGWSSRQLAERSGVSQPVIQNIESNRKKNISVDELVAFAKALDCEPADLDARLDTHGFAWKARRYDAIRALLEGAGA